MAAMLFATAAPAQDEFAPPFTVPERAGSADGLVPHGVGEETRLAADFDQDGRNDLAIILTAEDYRVLVVALADAKGFRRIGQGTLDPYPLGAASLELKKGVLLVTDLTGGTTAIQSTYRYRFEKETGRMRLIGDDVSLYSRTWQHGTTTISTNRLTGKRLTTVNDLVGEPGENAELGPDKVTSSKVDIATPLYLENAPAPDVTLGWGSE